MNTTTQTKDITGSAEIQMGFTALVEAFSNHWLGCGMSATEISVYTGTCARLFLKEGWLREELRAAGHLFWPAGALQAALLREVEVTMRDITDVAEEPIHVSTFPIPHVVSPTPNETIAAREIESQPSTSSPSPAGADAGVPSLERGCVADQPQGVNAATAATAATAAAGRGDTAALRGRWDANPVQAPVSDLARDLAEVIGVLKVAGDSVRERLTEITLDQQEAGWPERTTVNNAVAHLRRLASDLFNELSDFELKSKLNLQLRRR